jgi:hypothetical protein
MRFPETLTSRGLSAMTLLLLAGGPLLLALGLAACTPDPDEQAPQCPLVYLRPDAATLTRYDGRGTDLTNLVLSGRLQNVGGACKGLLGHKKLTAHAHVVMVLTRGPAAQGRDFDVPYNIAITRQGHVLEKQALTQHVTFPPNVDTVQVTGQDVDMAFPTNRGLNGQNYTIYFVFELSPAELDANQRALAAGR